MLSIMGRLRTIIAAGSLLLTATCAFGGPPTTTSRALHLGVDLPLSGAEKRAGIPVLNGVKFFVQRHPTLDGFDVTVVQSDDAAHGRTSPSQGVTNIQGFIADPTLVAVIGPLSSGVARKEIPIANFAHLAMVTPATGSQCLTRDVFLDAGLSPSRTAITCMDAALPPASDLRPTGTNNFFRLTTTDELQGAAAADFAFKTLHVTRVAAISDHETYGEGLAAAFTARLQKLGGTVVGHLDADLKTQPDTTPFLKGMKGVAAQAIYFAGFERGCAIRAQMKSVFDSGESTPFIGADGIALDPVCVKEAGTNALGIYGTVPIAYADNLASAADTIRAFKVAYPGPGDYSPYTMAGYDAAAVVYAALDRAIQSAGGRLPTRAAVTAEVAATAGFSGVTGLLGFDSAGDTTNRVVSIFEAASSDPRGRWKPVTSVDYTAALPY
jgi:branched-chain amino acid transport system substrate-binding protein